MTILKMPSLPVQRRFADDVRDGLTRTGQKELPSKYLYDNLGSALFDAITLLPEYGLTRADERLLQKHAREIAAHVPGKVTVSELGSGSGRKTRWILNALRGRAPFSYYPIEISHAALATCEMELRDIESVSIVGVESEYLAGLEEVAKRRDTDTHLLVLFLGSTIGNFDAGADARFLSDVRKTLREGDSLLLGTDLIKPRAQLIDAYDDPRGVTAAFNLNLLGRINRELKGDFDLRSFEHVARFNETTQSVEMHLRSKRVQTVTIADCDLAVDFFEGETIWTESSHKYTPQSISALAQTSGFDLKAQWTDEKWPFANSLFVAK
ncbi:MAG TPA: L-histidine N(alpha)-methyltransferase [Rudaea sp.]